MNKSRFLSMGEQGLISLTNFLSTIVLSRILPIEDFGLFSVGFAVFVILFGFQRAFVAIPISVLFRRAECSDYGVRDWVVVNRWLTVIVTVLVVFMWLVTGFLGGLDVFSSGLTVGLIVYVGMASYELKRRVLIQYGLVAGLVPAALIYSAVYIGLVFFFIPASKGYIYAALAMSLSALLASAYCSLMIRTRAPALEVKSAGCAHELARSLWEFGRWGGASHIVFSMYNGVVPVVLGALLGPTAPALLHVTKNIMQPVQTLINAIDGVDKPRAARALDNEGFSGVLRVLRSSFFVLAVIGGGYIMVASIFGSEISLALYGSKYSGVDSLVALWGCVFFLMIFAQPVESGLYVCRASDKLFLGRLVSALIGLTMLFLLVPIYGVEGGMFALIAAWSISFLIGAFSLARLRGRGA